MLSSLHTCNTLTKIISQNFVTIVSFFSNECHLSNTVKVWIILLTIGLLRIGHNTNIKHQYVTFHNKNWLKLRCYKSYEKLLKKVLPYFCKHIQLLCKLLCTQKNWLPSFFKKVHPKEANFLQCVPFFVTSVSFSTKNTQKCKNNALQCYLIIQTFTSYKIQGN